MANISTIVNNILSDSGVDITAKQDALSGSGIVRMSSGVASYITGTSSQFVKADGTLDNTAYQTALTNPVTGSGTTNYLPKFTGATTLGNSLMQEGTNAIGIGVTPSAWASTTKALQVLNGAVFGFGGSEVGLTANNYFDGSVSRYLSNATAGIYSMAGSQHAWLQAITGTAGANITWIQTMTLNASGRLLLGSTTDNGLRFQVTGNSSFSDNIGIGGLSSAARIINISKNITGSTIGFGIAQVNNVANDVTAGARVFYSEVGTQAASFTLPELNHYYAVQGTFGAGSAVTNQYGFRVFNNLIGATNNYGFFGDIASGTGRWNLYMNGTAANFLNGNTGIGRSPGVPLDVSGTIRSVGSTGASSPRINLLSSGFWTWGIYGDGNNLKFQNDATDRLTLNSDGNLGLGVVPSAWSTGTFFLAQQIGGGGSFIAAPRDTSSQIIVGTNAYFNGTNWIRVSANASAFYQQNVGQHIWFNAPSGTAGTAATLTQAMTLTASGNLLVGTSTDVTGKVQVVGAGGIRVNEDGSGTKVLSIRSDFAGVDPAINVVTSNSLLLMTANTERARIFSDGNVGIGTTTNAGYKLDVNGTMRVSGVGSFASTTSTGRIEFGTSAFKGIMNYDAVTTGLWSFNNQTAGASTVDYFQFQADGAAILTLKKSGAATFSSSVTAAGGVKTTGGNGFNDTDGTRTVGLYSNFTASTAGVGTTSNHDFAFYTNTAERMRITSGGNVGIAMTPSYKLDVTGEARVSNAIAIGTTPDVLFPLKVGSLMTVSSTGNVGIGNTTPDTTFSTIAKGMIINGGSTGSTYLLFQNSTTGTAFTDGAVVGINSSRELFLWNNEAAITSLGTNGIERLRISLDGRVMIGTSSNSTFRLDVNGTSRFQESMVVTRSQDATTAVSVINTTSGVNAFSAFQLGYDIAGGTAFASLAYGSAGVTVNGAFRPSGTTLASYGSGGLNLFSQSQPIRFFTGAGTGTEVMSINNAGAATFSSTITSNATSGNASFIASGSGTVGGASYIDFLRATNTSVGATNPNKTFRLNSTGGLEIVNSAYSSVIYTLTDAGAATFASNVTVNGTLSVAGSSTFSSNINKPITVKTAAYTLTDSDYTVVGNTNLSSFTFTLPTAVGRTGRIYAIKNYTGGNVLTVDGNGSETIDGYTTYTLSCQSGIIIQSDGSNWYVIADIADTSCFVPN